MFRDPHLRPANGSRRERRRHETHARIFEAAMRLFAERGFANTPVEEITEAADVAKGTFFNYFPTKESILEALAERQLSVVKAAEERAQAAPAIRPVLLEMVHGLADRPSRSPLLLRSLLGVAMTNNTLSKFLGRVLEAGRGHLSSILTRGQQLGEVRSDWPAIELARVMQHAFFGTNMIWALSARSDLDKWIDKTFEIVWRGIAAEAIAIENTPAGSAGKER
jgi:AcrR family transcriptional regulator